MPESTLAKAIEELHSVVEALKELMEREYPRRSEIDDKLEAQRQAALQAFVSKRVSRQRWVFILALAPLMVVASFFLTISTVSTCFLGRNQSEPPSFCGTLLPGYNETRDRQQDFTEDYTGMKEDLGDIKDDLTEVKDLLRQRR